MPIITISRGSYSNGKEVAEKLAEKLNYDCLSRDVLIDASDTFKIPEVKLVRAIHDAPSILDRFSHGKKRYIAYIREALLKYTEKDNVVYHGLAGHFFLQGIPHALKIRITADMDIRSKREAEKENISVETARHILIKDDEERRKWALGLYGIDPWDSRIYDITINIGCVTADDAVNLIAQAAALPCFQKTAKSEKLFQDRLLEARIQEILPTETVAAKDGVVVVTVNAPLIQESYVIKDIQDKLKKSGIEGIKDIRVNVLPINAYV